MKAIWNVGGHRSRNQITACIFALFLALAMTFHANVAEAKADIFFEFTNVTTHPGGIKITGYFYNRGNSGATVTKMHFRGNVDGRDINCMFDNSSVGWIEAYGSKNYSYTIRDSYYRYYKDNPPWKLNYNVTFR